VGGLALLTLLVGVAMHAAPASAGDTYWSYSYKDIDVTSVVGADRARKIAHDLRRLDLAIGKALGAEPEGSRPRTEVYVVPQATFDALFRKNSTISGVYLPNTYGGTILVNASVDWDEPLYDVYFGYSAALVNQGYATRLPQWFLTGLTQVFAASKVDRNDVVLGGINETRIMALQNGWIPLDALFSMRWSDPQLANPTFLSLYYAETWFVVHEIMFERWRAASFQNYFQRLDGGESEEQAFSASFDVSYDVLRKELRKAESVRMNIMRIAVPDENDPTAPRRLSDGEALGRLALVAAGIHQDLAENLKRAKDAAAIDPTNQDALAAIARTEIRMQDFPAALKSTDDLCALPGLRPHTAYLCAVDYTDLYTSSAAESGHLPTPKSELADKADKFYEVSLGANPVDPAAWEGLAGLLAVSRDAQKATAALPRAKHAWVEHERDAHLAGAVASLCALSNDYDSAVKFAIVAQKYALTTGDAQAAAAYLARLRSLAERRDASAPAALPATAGDKP
jgi:hypothetical protein